MILGLDSRPPSDAQIAAAKAAGIGLWAGYLGDPGDGISPMHLWPKDRFDAVKAAGMAIFAYVSGAQDPNVIKARGQSIGVKICVDVERFIREDGPWVDGWLAASGAGLYGNGSVHYNSSGFRLAAFHVYAGYFGYDPGVPWPDWLPRDSSPCAWQFQGTHPAFGIAVDSLRCEDAFASLFGSGGGTLTKPPRRRTIAKMSSGKTINLFVCGQDPKELFQNRWDGAVWSGWKSLGGTLGLPEITAAITNDRLDVFVIGQDGLTPNVITSLDEGATWSGFSTLGGAAGGPLLAIGSVSSGSGTGGGLTSPQAQQLQETHDRVVKSGLGGG